MSVLDDMRRQGQTQIRFETAAQMQARRGTCVLCGKNPACPEDPYSCRACLDGLVASGGTRV